MYAFAKSVMMILKTKFTSFVTVLHMKFSEKKLYDKLNKKIITAIPMMPVN